MLPPESLHSCATSESGFRHQLDFVQLRRKAAVGGDTSSHVSDTHVMSFYRMSDVEVKVEKEEEL